MNQTSVKSFLSNQPQQAEVLIINPPFYRLQNESLMHYPPGCTYMAATLERAGIESMIYNADYDPNKKTIIGNSNHINMKGMLEQRKTYEQRLNDPQDPIWSEIQQVVEKYNPNFLVISAFSTTLTAGKLIAKRAKAWKPSLVTIFEGSFNRGLHCSVEFTPKVDFSSIDFAIRKEPEHTIVELVQALKAGQTDFSSVLGIVWKNQEGQIIQNEDRPAIQDLDDLPMPARHRIIGANKFPAHAFQGVYGSRGCPYDCVFCGIQVGMGAKPRIRSAQSIVDEMEHVYRTYGTRYFFLCDDIFFIRKDRARKFCELLIEKNLPIYFSAMTRAEMVDDVTMSLVKKAGGQSISVGVEVGNEKVRELIKKGNTVEDVRTAAKIIHRNGLRMVAFVIVGLPWEGKEEISETVELVKEINPYIVFPYMSTPAEGTGLAEIMAEKNPMGMESFTQSFTDSSHINPAKGYSDKLDPQQREVVLNWAMEEFSKINKRNLLKDFSRRPGFYYALAGDMGFFKSPKLLWSHIKDLVA